MFVDLRGDQALGDQLLGGEPSESTGQKATSDVPEVPVTIVPPPGLAHPKPAKVKKRLRKPKSHRAESSTKRPRAAIDEAYSDLDEILAGQGDASPLIVRPEREHLPDETKQAVQSDKRRNNASFGFLAALGAATLAFWFGVVLVISRFQIVEPFLLSQFSESLQSVYSATFGRAEITQGFGQIFGGLGWCLWLVGAALVVSSAAQFINSFVGILLGRSLLGWSDGIVAALAILALFVMVAIVLTHTSFAKKQNRLLDAYESPAALDRGPVGNIDLLRTEINNNARTFQRTMVVSMSVPVLIFVFSVVRLFIKLPDPER